MVEKEAAKQELSKLANKLGIPIAFKEDFETASETVIVTFSDMTQRHIWVNIDPYMKGNQIFVNAQLKATDHRLNDIEI